MKALKFVASVLLFLSFLLSPILADEASSLGYLEGTVVISRADEDICPLTVNNFNDDDSFENGYAWRNTAVVPPDYGAWAECYNADYVCGVQLLFSQVGNHGDETMDVFVWDYDADGNPPPGPDPGNVICILTDICPENIAFWPDVSTHNIQVCCYTGGFHFVGFWGNWPTDTNKWYIAADENGPPSICSRTKVVVGSGCGDGWVEPTVAFPNCKALGIREFAGSSDCNSSSVPDPASYETTWGAIKSFY